MKRLYSHEGGIVSRRIREVFLEKFREVALTIGLLPGMAVVRVSEEY